MINYRWISKYMEKSLKILRAEEKYENQNMFHKPQIHFTKISQASNSPCENFTS